jgi:probable rRNA maturation factor
MLTPSIGKHSRTRLVLEFTEGFSALRFYFRKMEPTIIFRQRVPGLSKLQLAAFVSEVCKSVKLAGAVTVLVTDNREMRALNQRFRGKKISTDVLSFPGPEFLEDFAGDIAVCLDVAAKNAATLGHSVSIEVRVLVLHGILHLAGYDHEADSGEMSGEMNRIETHLRRKLGLPQSLIERVEKPLSTRRKARSHS